MIHERLLPPRLSSPSEMDPEGLTHDPGVPTFLQKNEGDPAIKVGGLGILLLLICTNLSDAEFFTKVKRASTSSNPKDASPRS